MEHVIVRISRAVKHSESWYDKPVGQLVVENVHPKDKESMSLGLRIIVACGM